MKALTCRRSIVSLALVQLLLPSTADAYIDPGTGGVLVQLLTGGIAGAIVILKLYWSKVAGLFRRRKKLEP